jgi:hypothetical protein
MLAQTLRLLALCFGDQRMKHRLLSVLRLTLVLPLAACAMEVSKPGPDGLTPQAVALAEVVKLGCMPYALGEKSEAAAMKEGGLRRQTSVPSYPSPPSLQRHYQSEGPGNPGVTIYGPGCTVRGLGGDAAAFNSALDRVYIQRFGQDYARGALPAQLIDDQLPGMKRFCAAGSIFESYPDPQGGIVQGGFNVRISPVPACKDVS